MTINISIPKDAPIAELKPRITIVGVGGGGCNAVNTMIQQKLDGCDFVVANTDAQSLSQARTDRRIQLGAVTTQGLGAGARPEIGRAAAEEALEEVLEQLQGSHMAFIAAGMGGGTGTGAAPVLARAAREQGILTVGVVTKPFGFEGSHRMRLAEEGIKELEEYVDTLIIIPNQNLFRVANEKTTFADAFAIADDVLYSGVRSVTDLMVMPGLINLDFADVRTVMSEMGKAMMGTGEAEGDRRALDAAEAAISNPLLDDTSMKGAKGVLISIAGGSDMTLFEADEAANRIRSEVDENALINFGATFDDSLEGKLRVSVVATGIQAEAGQVPQTPELVTEPAKARPTAARPGLASKPVIPARPAATEAQPLIPKRGVAGLASAITAPAARKPEAMKEEKPGDEVEPLILTERAPEMKSQPVPEPVAASSQPSAVIGQPIEAQDQEEEKSVVMSDAQPKPEPTPSASVTSDATPRAGTKDAFIPEPPASANAPAQPNPEPIMQADLANAVHADPQPKSVKKKTPSIFERVTGVGRRASEPEAKEPEPEQQPLLGVGAEDRSKPSSQEDDILDIPAFLRRQVS